MVLRAAIKTAMISTPASAVAGAIFMLVDSSQRTVYDRVCGRFQSKAHALIIVCCWQLTGTHVAHLNGLNDTVDEAKADEAEAVAVDATQIHFWFRFLTIGVGCLLVIVRFEML